MKRFIAPAFVVLLLAAPASATPFIPCMPWECGSNGAWLGQNIVFHELDTAGQPNDAGVIYAGFIDDLGHPLTLDVDRDKLSGTRPGGQVLDGGALADHAIILLKTGGKDGKEFKLKITAVSTTTFWVDPPHTNVPVYHFQFSPVLPGCDRRETKCGNWQDVCRPPSDPGPEWNGLNGMALIFRGDRYVANDKSVKETTGTDTWFNIACAGTTVAKMHLLRHTWAASDPGHVTTQDKRQAVLKMLSADYCGDGKPWTVNGHPLLYTYVQSWVPEAPAPLDWSAAATLDAVWNKNGAVCLNIPRLKDLYPHIRPKIVTSCSPTKTLKPCTQGLMGELKNGALQPWSPLGYAISANKGP